MFGSNSRDAAVTCVGLPLVAVLLWRHGLLSWLLVRIGFALTLLMTLNPPLPVGGAVAIGVVAVSAAVALLMVTRRAERVLLGNLGVSVRRQVALVALPAVLSEVLLAVLRP